MNIFKRYQKQSGFNTVEYNSGVAEIPDYQSMSTDEFVKAILDRMSNSTETDKEIFTEMIRKWVEEMKQRTWDDEKQREVRDFIYEMF